MLSQKITEDIRNAIEKYYHASGLSLEELAERLAVNKSTFYGWLTGDSKRIHRSNWHRLYPEIREYLSAPDSSYTSAPDVDRFRSRLFDAVMDLDIDSVAKVKVLKLIKDIK